MGTIRKKGVDLSLNNVLDKISGKNIILLSQEKVENGFIMCEVYEETEHEIKARLYLSPGAKIKKHMHIDDWEEYILENGEILTCKKGESHSFENPYEDKWYILGSVKYK